MNKEEQRIAIAEACGWRDIHTFREYDGTCVIDGVYKNNPDGFRTIIPDYLNDLNAMHEAEKVLTVSQHSDYICQLYYKTMGLGKGICDWQKLAGATAAQRAEAFLKTLNLWKEEL